MSFKPAAACLATTLVLTACGITPETSAFNSDTVTVRTTSTGPRAAARRIAQGEADRVCGTQGRVAEYASTSTSATEDNREDHLFLCVEPTSSATST